MSNKPTLVILAAGIGSRYGGLKQLDTFTPQGYTILDLLSSVESIYTFALLNFFWSDFFLPRKKVLS